MALSSGQLTRWVAKWASAYPKSHDDVLLPLHGKTAFGFGDLDAVYEWVFDNLWPRRHIRDLHQGIDEDQARDFTRRAIACPDDLGALLLAKLLPGAGIGGASAVLMAARPSDY